MGDWISRLTRSLRMGMMGGREDTGYTSKRFAPHEREHIALQPRGTSNPASRASYRSAPGSAGSGPARVWPGLSRQAGQEDESVGQESEDSYLLTTGGALQRQSCGGGGNMTFSWTPSRVFLNPLLPSPPAPVNISITQVESLQISLE